MATTGNQMLRRIVKDHQKKVAHRMLEELKAAQAVRQEDAKALEKPQKEAT